MSEQTSVVWGNWAGNQRAHVAAILRPTSEEELVEGVLAAVREGHPVGAAGSGHSFSQIVESAHTVVDVRGVSGLVEADAQAQTATVLAGTTIQALGPLLWEHGLALRTMGDIDKQTVAGAIATGTHGSGVAYGSIPSSVRSLRLVTGAGDVLDVDTTDEETLHAAQVAIGTLGVVTRVTLDVTAAYRLQEHVEVLPVEEVLEHWRDGAPDERHYQFFYAPTDSSYALYDLPPFPRDHCWVKVLREVPVEPETAAIEGEHGSRSGRSYLIYPDTADEVATWVELEYMVDARDAKAAFVELRDMVLSRSPEAISPIQLRWIKGEPAFLSPFNGRDSVSISVSGELSHDWEAFLFAVDECLRRWSPRPHWGKKYFLDADRTRAVYPQLDRFLAVRERLDPDGLMLNAHLRDVLGV